MRRSLALALVASLLLAGCAAGPGAGTATDGTATDGTATDGTATYVLRSDLPDGVASATLTVRAVFVDDREDLGPCYPEAFTGPYQPTITPVPPPAGACHRSETATVTLRPGGTATATFPVPASARGHALLVTDATVRAGNGTALSGVRGVSGATLLAAPADPADRHAVTVRVEAYGDRSYDYWLYGA